MGRRRTIRAQTALAGGLALLLTGCSAGLEQLPLPSPEAGGSSYGLTAVFSSALNLPAKAKVRLYGADIGEVRSIKASDFTARVRMRIRTEVPLYEGTTAELRSATPLGDVFVQLRPTSDGAPQTALLRDGDTIDMPSTSAAPTVEELLNSLAMLVNGGAIRALTNNINGAGRAVGGRGEKLADLIGQTNTFLARMSARTEQIDTTLRRTADLAATLNARQETLDTALSAGAPALAVVADNTAALADLTETSARITRQLSKFPSIKGTDTRSVIADINELSRVFNDISVDPNLSLDAFNRLIAILVKSTNATSAHALLEIAQLALVPWPDMNYPGDIGFHGPDGTDWHNMIGSLRYQWNLLLSQVYGPHR